MTGGWRAERARGGEWVAARVVRTDFGATVSMVRRRRPLDIPKHWTRTEAQAYVNGLVARGELD